jgi:hypothetical protein
VRKKQLGLFLVVTGFIFAIIQGWAIVNLILYDFSFTSKTLQKLVVDIFWFGVAIGAIYLGKDL